VSDADIGTVDALASFALEARRRGYQVRLRGASPALRELLVLAALDAVLPCEDAPPRARGRRAPRVRGGSAVRRAERTGRYRGRT
jgi:hypothetical protein